MRRAHLLEFIEENKYAPRILTEFEKNKYVFLLYFEAFAKVVAFVISSKMFDFGTISSFLQR